VTFFLYLNDVDEGGATQFSDITLGSANADSMNGKGPISIDVIPKKGTALVWPNVLDDDLDEMDDRTYHAALPVIKGEKYGANAWFHLRSFSKDDPCDHDALDELRYWIETEEDSE
jgi:prolyl 4-hydroxylase